MLASNVPLGRPQTPPASPGSGPRRAASGTAMSIHGAASGSGSSSTTLCAVDGQAGAADPERGPAVEHSLLVVVVEDLDPLDRGERRPRGALDQGVDEQVEVIARLLGDQIREHGQRQRIRVIEDGQLARAETDLPVEAHEVLAGRRRAVHREDAVGVVLRVQLGVGEAGDDRQRRLRPVALDQRQVAGKPDVEDHEARPVDRDVVVADLHHRRDPGLGTALQVRPDGEQLHRVRQAVGEDLGETHDDARSARRHLGAPRVALVVDAGHRAAGDEVRPVDDGGRIRVVGPAQLDRDLEGLGDREREDLQGDVVEHVGRPARPGVGRVVVRDGPERVDVQQALLRAGAARRPRDDEVVDQELEDLGRLDHVVVVGRNGHRVAASADADEALGRLLGVVGSFLRRPARGLPAHAQREAVRHRGGHEAEDQRGALLPGRAGHRDAAARRHPRLLVVLDGPDRCGGNGSGKLGRTRGGGAVLRGTDDLVAHHERQGLGRLLVGIVERRDRNREAAGRDGQRRFAPHGAVVLTGLCRAVCGMPDGAHGRAGRNALGSHPEGEGAAFDDGDVGDAHRATALRGQGRGREQEGQHRHDEQRSVHRGVSSDGGPPPRHSAGPIVRRRKEAGAPQGEHERRSA